MGEEANCKVVCKDDVIHEIVREEKKIFLLIKKKREKKKTLYHKVFILFSLL
jgi:dephospho-CoA kinase